MAAGCVSTKGFQTFVMTGDAIIDVSFDPFKPKHQIPRDHDIITPQYGRSYSETPANRASDLTILPESQVSLPTSPQDVTAFVPKFIQLSEDSRGKRKLHQQSTDFDIKHSRTEDVTNESERTLANQRDIMDHPPNLESADNKSKQSITSECDDQPVSEQTATQSSLPRVCNTGRRVDYEFGGIALGTALRRYVETTGDTATSSGVHEEQLRHFVDVYLRQNPKYLEEHHLASSDMCLIPVRHLASSLSDCQVNLEIDEGRNYADFVDKVQRSTKIKVFDESFLLDCFREAHPEFTLRLRNKKHMTQLFDSEPVADLELKVQQPVSTTSHVPLITPILCRADYTCEGFLLRKHFKQAGGKKVPYGKRYWKKVYTNLKGQILYQHAQDERASIKELASSNYIHLTNATARMIKHRKYKHTFLLTLADQSEYKFATKSEDELDRWISAVNTLAAFSTEKPEQQFYVHSATTGDLDCLIDYHNECCVTLNNELRSMQSASQSQRTVDKTALAKKTKEIERHGLYFKTLQSKVAKQHLSHEHDISASQSDAVTSISHTNLGHLRGLLMPGSRLSYKLAIYRDEMEQFSVDTEF